MKNELHTTLQLPERQLGRTARALDDRRHHDRLRKDWDDMLITETETPPRVLASRPSADPRVQWQARVSADRGRLSVVAVIEPTSTPIVVELPTETELRGLLAGAGQETNDTWTCAECSTVNAASRLWCASCSHHRRGDHA